MLIGQRHRSLLSSSSEQRRFSLAERRNNLCVVAAPEGVAYLQEAHAEAEVYTAALDRGLNDHKYILPGLGDFGDRLFGTN